MGFLESLARVIDRINEHVGRVIAWLALFMVLVQFIVVVMRYVFGLGSIFMQESIVYMHALVFLVASGYTLLHDGHVRIDIIYGNVTVRRKALIDFCGVFFVLLPVCGLVWWTAFPYVFASWKVFEGSPETSGIQAVFLLKSAILVFVTLVALQGISLSVRSLFTLMGIGPAAEAAEDSEGIKL